MKEKRELSRAEVARQRRAQRAANELTQTGKRATKPMIQPVTRRVPPSAHQPAFVKVAPKRQFHIALGTPDVRLRYSHSAGQNQPDRSWRIAALVLALLLGVAIYFALVHPYFNIPSVTVIGNRRISREELSNAAGVLGQSIFTIQPEDVEMRLRLNYPELLSVEAEVYLPNHVYVTVEEREPVILWIQDNGYTWIDQYGVAFRPREVLEGLVAVRGLANPKPGISQDPLVPSSYMPPELAQAILALAPSVPADTTMLYDDTHGLGWEDGRGWRVFFGMDSRNIALKARVYESLVQSLTARNISPVYINVAYPEAPYYRLSVEAEYKPVVGNGY